MASVRSRLASSWHMPGIHSTALLGIWAVVITSALVNLVFTSDAQLCSALAETGYWAGAEADHLSIWQPERCTTAVYKASDIHECLGNKSIALYGDSTARQVFWALSEKINVPVNRSARHEDHQVATGSNVRLQYEWDVYLENPDLYELLEHKRSGIETEVGILMIGAGLHFAAWKNNSFLDFKTTMMKLYRRQETVTPDSQMGVYIMPVLPAWYAHVADHVKHVTALLVNQLNDWVLNDMQRNITPSFKKTYLWSYNKMVLSNKQAYDISAIHVKESVAHQKADILLNHYCNPILAEKRKLPKNASCCVPSGPKQRGQWVVLAASSIGILGSLLSLAATEEEHRSRKLSKEANRALLVFCSALFFCFVTDQTQSFGKLLKQHDKVQFGVFCLAGVALVLVSDLVIEFRKRQSPSISSKTSSTLLNHGQTEEWKGWMQAAILIYHWTGTSSNLTIYKGIRLLVAAYLFMSGYGTTLAILKTEGSLWKKLTRQLIRLNLLSIALSYTMATSYLDYYFAPLVSMWIIATYACLGLFRSWNNNLALVLVKIFVCCSLSSFLLFKDGIVEHVFYVLEQTCNVSLNAKEWRFRAGLDSFIVYVGILTAILVVKCRNVEGDIELGTKQEYTLEQGSTRSGWMRSIRSRCSRKNTMLTTLMNVLFGASLIAIWVLLASKKGTKMSYNAIHPFISPLPIFGYVLVRQCHPLLRANHSVVLARLGRCSLETFTLQFHLLLANNTSAVLSINLLAGLPRVGIVRAAELCFIMLAFLFISDKVAQASGVLVALLFDVGTSSSSAPDANQYSIVAQRDEYEDVIEDDGLQSHKDGSLHPLSWRTIPFSLASQHHSYRIGGALAIIVLFNWLGYP